jgi:glucokinase
VHRDTWAGIDIGGTKIAVVLSLNPPEITIRAEFATIPSRGPEATIDLIKEELYRLLAELKTSPDSLRGIGVSCGGPLDPCTGVIQAPPNLPTWIDVHIVDILTKEFNCPVALENDANAGALAEHRYGAGRGSNHMIFLTMGTGLGAGIIIHNKLYRGHNDMAGEIGHVRLTRKGPMGYNKAGSVEGWASGAGMAQVAKQALNTAVRNEQRTLLFEMARQGSVTAKDVGLAAEKGDVVARRIIRTCGRKLGLTLAILIDVLNPERIILGGLVTRLGDLLLDPARKSLREEALGSALAACKIMPSMLGERIGDVSALCVAMDAGAQQGADTEREMTSA